MNFDASLISELSKQLGRFVEIFTDSGLPISGVLYSVEDDMLGITQMTPGYGSMIPTLVPLSAVNAIRV
ncbi:hypothetical protein SFC42_15750 [Priestia filamentosa]|uniref:hypothetical protein n=1 Tax=Priestia filamentosa TaxID=1402861 RepID=UPI0039836E9E